MLNIRESTFADGRILSELSMIILRQIDFSFIKEVGLENLKSLIEQCYTDPRYRDDYMQAVVAEFNQEIVGAAFGFNNEQEDKINEIFDTLLYENFGVRQGFEAKEAVSDEWYLDTIAVFEHMRGRGIGTKLLKFLPHIAKKYGKICVGLNVADTNLAAKKLYLSHGFVETGKKRLGNQGFTHMRWYF
ncbi:MAG: GNAT family N-acetyltransferase [Lactobacillales bacterium]|jgi:ribosomal protein S18 acetylase RimI-like enzyme|nr:GNAT family N-acetyltransferase [Lactobacillales bacterium]